MISTNTLSFLKMEKSLTLPGNRYSKIVKWKIKDGGTYSNGTLLCLYQQDGKEKVLKFKASEVGSVLEKLINEGDDIDPGTPILKVKGCTHPVVMKDMCAECGADLREDFGVAGDRKSSTSATVAMIHSVPELIVSEEKALELGRADEKRLLQNRKLVLLVDLDETVLHTTNDNIPANLKDVYHFQLWHGQSLLWYHTKFRPNTLRFLEVISKLFELHICTFGARMYAHTMARYLDPEGKFFSHRILSRDECFDARSKTANLKALFPCGDSMVCIIDDRDEVWNFAPNMIRVKPYIFFDGTADINAPPGLDKGKGDVPDNNNFKPKRQVRIIKIPKEKSQSDNSGSEFKETNYMISDKTVGDNEQSKIAMDDTVDCQEKSVDFDKAKEVDEKIQPDISEQSNIDKGCIEEVMDVSDCTSQENNQPNSVSSESLVSQDPNPVETSNKSPDETSEYTEQSDRAKHDNIKDKCADSKDNKLIEESSSQNDGKNPIPNEPSTQVDCNIDVDTCSKDSTEFEEVIEWSDEDDYLMYLQDILTKIHTAYFDMYDQIKDKESVKKEDLPNLKKIIPYVKKKVLQGVNIVFSSVVPTNQALERSRAYHVAKSLGAEVHSEIKVKSTENTGTTHLVAAKLGTQKVRTAVKQKGIHIVRPEWLWTCNDRWEHVEEQVFLLDETHQYRDARDSPDVSLMKENIKRKADDSIDCQSQGDSEAIVKLFKRAKTVEDEKQDVENLTDKTPVEMETTDNSVHSIEKAENMVASSSRRVRRFSETINPLYSFSSKDFEDMDKEVDEILTDSSDSEEASGVNNKTDKNMDEPNSEDSEGEEAQLRNKVLGKAEDSSSEDSMSGDSPRGWKRKTSQDREYDDNSYLLEIDDPGEANMALLKAAQSSPHWLFEESSNSQDGSVDSIGSADEEIAAAIEKELFK